MESNNGPNDQGQVQQIVIPGHRISKSLMRKGGDEVRIRSSLIVSLNPLNPLTPPTVAHGLLTLKLSQYAATADSRRLEHEEVLGAAGHALSPLVE